jgi:hypothetical protein
LALKQFCARDDEAGIVSLVRERWKNKLDVDDGDGDD